MAKYLIDVQTVSTFRVNDDSVEAAIATLRASGKLMDPAMIDGRGVTLVNFNFKEEPEIIEVDCEDCGRCDDCID